MERRWHTLADGVRLEVLFLAADAPQAAPQAHRPPLLFVHGSFHGAWCWEENFLPFFSAAGHDCYALSLRGHGESEAPPAATRAAGTLHSHAADLASFIAATLQQPPVLVVHSLAGLVAYKYVSQLEQGCHLPLAGLVLLGAAPPSGASGTARRMAWRAPLRVSRIAW